jgi:hypothetical protein
MADRCFCCWTRLRCFFRSDLVGIMASSGTILNVLVTVKGEDSRGAFPACSASASAVSKRSCSIKDAIRVVMIVALVCVIIRKRSVL